MKKMIALVLELDGLKAEQARSIKALGAGLTYAGGFRQIGKDF